MIKKNINYKDDIDRVIFYISENPYHKHTLDELAKLSNFSKYHFHRVFFNYAGINVFTFIKLQKLKKASYQLAFRKNIKIIDIALEAGYETPESFSRIFKKIFSQTPSGFRKEPNWKNWHQQYKYKKISLKNNSSIQFIDFKETSIAFLEHKGPYELVYKTVSKFIEWRQKHKLSPKTNRTFNIIYHDPNNITPSEYRIDIATEIKSDLKTSNKDIHFKKIPSCKCVCLKHIGSWDLIEESIAYLYYYWFQNQTQFQLEDFPLFIEYKNFLPDVAEDKLLTYIYLPIK